MMAKPTPTRQTILEVKETLAGQRREFRCELVKLDRDELVVSYRSPVAGEVAGVALPAGTLSLGYFWETRPYNVYHWLGPDSTTLGLYFNISDTTRITSRQVSWRDLVVDVLVTPDGRCQVLDEDELPHDIEPKLRQRIDITTARLRREHQRHLVTFEARARDFIA